MKLVPIHVTGKKLLYEKIVKAGGEGIMLKDARSDYTSRGRPKSMFKAKRFEEVDAFVTGYLPAEEDSGWRGLIGSLEFSCLTETGKVHAIAFVSNISLEERKAATVCGRCGSKLLIKDDNVAGKRVVTYVHCEKCNVDYPEPKLDPEYIDRVAEIRGQEFTARVYRLKHATLERWREGVDGKRKEDCKISFKDITARFDREEL